MAMDPRLRMALMLLALLGLSGAARGADCVLNTNPVCGNAVDLGQIPGDAAGNAITRTGTGEAFFKTYVRENSSVYPRPLNVRIALQSPPNADYDMIVRCASCAATPVFVGSSGIAGTEIINITRADTMTDNSFWLVIEVRYRAGTGCGSWTLTIIGNTAAAQGALSCA
jgi:hypothetical protein